MVHQTWIVRVVMLCGLVVGSRAFLNLYLNSTETRRLLGIDGDLFYVRNGTVNDYALSFNLLIRAEHSRIFFSWQNLRQSGQYPMYYNLGIQMDQKFDVAMEPPQPNIPPEGEVPNRLSVFSVHLKCKGTHSAEVSIKLILNIAIFPGNITTIEIQRKKSCVHFTGGIDQSRGTWFKPDKNNSSKDEISRKLSATPTNIFYIAVGCACGVILLVALIVAVYYVRTQKSTSGERLSETSSSKGLTTQTTQSFLRPETPNQSIASLPMLKRGFSVSELKPSEVRTLLGEIHIERSRVSLGQVLMEGTFGRIFHGTITLGDDDTEEEHDVFIKTIIPDIAQKDQVETMLRESCLLKGLINPNLLSVAMSCVDGDYQPYSIYYYNSESNLKKFLLQCKVSELSPHQSLSTQQFVYMAIQICRGIQFLHRRRIAHKDVACRNCIVDSQWVVKVTDNALSRDFFPNDYHCLGDNENRPVKWMPVEALQERRYTMASDVWSFGVLLWELMMMGQQPYADIDPFEMATYLKEGYRIAQPHNCPDELFAVMACCWAMNAEERPKIAQLQLCLQDFYQALGRFV